MFVLLLTVQLALASLLLNNPALHFSLRRRGGRLAIHEPANLTNVLDLLQRTEGRYLRAYRDVENNRLVRRWRSDQDDEAMLDESGLNGRWYSELHIGDPPQVLELDLDFLSPDFYTLLTTSEGGSKFNTFFSQSYTSSNDFPHPLCRQSTDVFHLHNAKPATKLEWPICQPSKSSRHTLSRSGTILGLAPNPVSQSKSLKRVTAPSFVHLLYQKGIIPSPIWSVTILDSESGILSLGGTLAVEFEEAKTRTEVELKYLGQGNIKAKVEKEVDARMASAMPAGSSVEDHFKWTDVSGASGWWTGLMSGVWVDGVKILKNQPFLIDLSCPFIIAPPTAFHHFYSSISGSKPLSIPTLLNSSSEDLQDRLENSFHLFPCLNPPVISLELAGWPFPFASSSHSTHADAIHGPAGGPFSLGKVEEVLKPGTDTGPGGTPPPGRTAGVNSGYCVGIVVQSDTGERVDRRRQESGMRDVWVLGEPFFRGTGVVFDDGEWTGKPRIGFRSY